MRQELSAVLLAGMLVLAGCSAVEQATGPESTTGPGTVNFYVSDQQNAIDDFEHLNATVSEVTFRRATDDGENATASFDLDATVDLTRLKGDNATLLESYDLEPGNYTGVVVEVSAVNGTLTDGSAADVELPSEKLQLNENFRVEENASVDFVYDVSVVKAGKSGRYNVRPVASESGTDRPIERVDRDGRPADGDDGEDEDDTAGGNGGNGDGAADSSQGQQGSLAFYVSDERNAIDDFRHLNVTVSTVGFQRGGESGSWTERDAGNRTVDLTRLKGDNATLLREYDLPTGDYTKVFVHVSEVDGTLTDGSDAEVKLPSQKLQLTEEFGIEANASTEFVYDVTVVERGNSGAYNLKPQASESGTDRTIERVDEGDDNTDTDDETDADTDETDDSDGTDDGEEDDDSDDGDSGDENDGSEESDA